MSSVLISIIVPAYNIESHIGRCLDSILGYQMVFPGRVEYYYNTGRIVQQDKIAGLKDLLSGSFIEPGLWNKLYHKKLFYTLLYENVMPMDIRINEDVLMKWTNGNSTFIGLHTCFVA